MKAASRPRRATVPASTWRVGASSHPPSRGGSAPRGRTKAGQLQRQPVAGENGLRAGAEDDKKRGEAADDYEESERRGGEQPVDPVEALPAGRRKEAPGEETGRRRVQEGE